MSITTKIGAIIGTILTYSLCFGLQQWLGSYLGTAVFVGIAFLGYLVSKILYGRLYTWQDYYSDHGGLQ